MTLEEAKELKIEKKVEIELGFDPKMNKST